MLARVGGTLLLLSDLNSLVLATSAIALLCGLVAGILTFERPLVGLLALGMTAASATNRRNTVQTDRATVPLKRRTARWRVDRNCDAR